jgi:hypothetical protein
MATYLAKWILNIASYITPTQGKVQQETKWEVLNRSYSWTFFIASATVF